MLRRKQERLPPGRPAFQVKLFVGLALSWIALFAFFHIFPEADAGFSSLFCSGEDMAATRCDLFPARGHWLTGYFRPLFYWVPVAALVMVAVDAGWQYMRLAPGHRTRLRDELLVLAAYLAGPILLVNGFMKGYSGRMRPVDSLPFGGEHAFLAVGDFSGPCAGNCSFASGEAAAAGWLLWLIPLFEERWRPLVAAPILYVSLAAPLLRVITGSHFLSDAVLGWLIGAASVPALVVLSRLLPAGISATLDRIR